MPAIFFSRAIVEQELRRVKRAKRPRVYCIVRFEYMLRNNWAYAICLNDSDFKKIMSNLNSCSHVVLWASKRFERHRENIQSLQAMDDNEDEIGI